MDKLQFYTKILFAGALIYLASAMLLFVYEARQFRLAISQLTDQISTMQASMDMPRILNQVDDVTREVAATRDLVPQILKQVEATRKLVPPVLEQVAQTQKLVPTILEEVTQVRTQIPGILQEVENTRALVPGVLSEISAVRAEIPDLLEKSQSLIHDAQKISSDMGTGIVHGTVKGVITAPIKIIETGFETVGDGIVSVGNTADKLMRQTADPQPKSEE